MKLSLLFIASWLVIASAQPNNGTIIRVINGTFDDNNSRNPYNDYTDNNLVNTSDPDSSASNPLIATTAKQIMGFGALMAAFF
jgi:hypothetical protein